MASSADSQARVLHGFRLVPLALDFCCPTCQKEFHDTVVGELVEEDLAEWCARMQCASFDGDVAAMRSHLSKEQERVRKRSELMRGAAEAVRVGGQTHLDAFVNFMKTDWAIFRREVVEEAILPDQRVAREPDRMRISSGAGEHRSARCFGFRCEEDTGNRWAPAVSIVERVNEYPVVWTDYFGEPGFCSETLWCHRLSWKTLSERFPKLVCRLHWLSNITAS